ncbi:DUF1285 domain-containing protein [Salinicola rhizosphaerae]|uniref:DUF1285 domain-containing protein n=1 Tax=Salinicola rhizosphaerae TaxID=1443141 RepID=A0ABQ3DMQ6_9GAMM|nr:DUF1285 domain-containing protein [Salinicola rhizosphaerae]GHB08185.1 hypothetical protein GCM10009038_01880 [Salinicola rhizosphaerae]
MTLDALFQQLDAQTLPPLERWHPAICGEMDLVIAANGEWIHEGTAITRPRLVGLLSRVMRREADGDYYLVTPGEKLRIAVEDRPLMVIDADWTGEGWQLATADGDRFLLDAEHRMTLAPTPEGNWLPVVPVRHGLEARLHRNLFYRLIDAATEEEGELGLWSAGVWHVLGRLYDA